MTMDQATDIMRYIKRRQKITPACTTQNAMKMNIAGKQAFAFQRLAVIRIKNVADTSYVPAVTVWMSENVHTIQSAAPDFFVVTAPVN